MSPILESLKGFRCRLRCGAVAQPEFFSKRTDEDALKRRVKNLHIVRLDGEGIDTIDNLSLMVGAFPIRCIDSVTEQTMRCDMMPYKCMHL